MTDPTLAGSRFSCEAREVMLRDRGIVRDGKVIVLLSVGNFIIPRTLELAELSDEDLAHAEQFVIRDLGIEYPEIAGDAEARDLVLNAVRGVIFVETKSFLAYHEERGKWAWHEVPLGYTDDRGRHGDQ